jgi:hypothetical protein
VWISIANLVPDPDLIPVPTPDLIPDLIPVPVPVPILVLTPDPAQIPVPDRGSSVDPTINSEFGATLPRVKL